MCPTHFQNPEPQFKKLPKNHKQPPNFLLWSQSLRFFEQKLVEEGAYGEKPAPYDEIEYARNGRYNKNQIGQRRTDEGRKFLGRLVVVTATKSL